MKDLFKIIDKMSEGGRPLNDEIKKLLMNYDKELLSYAEKAAFRACSDNFGDDVYIRGLIEFTNICRNDCYYCGIRNGNHCIKRYRLTENEILDCCKKGYELGFRTFVLQGGEDMYFDDERLAGIVASIRSEFPDCAITLSVGERSKESYRRLYEAGADRYLLRHESADKGHYESLHPKSMSFDNRMRCLEVLKDIGYQVGCGFMVGSPYQSVDCIVKDLQFISDFRPHMIGIGPFIAHRDTPFSNYPSGSVDLTLLLISLLRLMNPKALIPATTALATISGDGRRLGIKAGANVIMPNLSPLDVRGKYELYDNKIYAGDESAQEIESLKKHVASLGRRIVVDRGDSPILQKKCAPF